MLIELDETTSTNEYIKDLAKSASPSGTVVTAKCQSGGKGSKGRSFNSPVGGLYLSILWDLKVPGDELAELTKVSAAAVRRAIVKSFGIEPAIKPINDIYFKGKKICGILCESLTFKTSTRSIIGIGINVNTDIKKLPEEVREIAGSIKELTGSEKDLDIDFLKNNLIEELNSLLSDYEKEFAIYKEEYEKWSSLQKQY